MMFSIWLQWDGYDRVFRPVRPSDNSSELVDEGFYKLDFVTLDAPVAVKDDDDSKA